MQEVKDAIPGLTYNDDDVRINSLIKVSRQLAEDITNLRLYTQTIDISYDYFPKGKFDLGIWPLQSIDSVKYYDTNSPSIQQTLTVNTDYYADTTVIGGRIWVESIWPSIYDKPNAVTVRVTAGYSSRDNIPEKIKEGIKLHVQGLYDGDMELMKVAEKILFSARMEMHRD